jgi:DNA-binding protein H-NS
MMARNSLTELLAQKAALEQEIAEMQRSSRAEAVAKVKALMAEFGLTPADLTGNGPAPRSAKPAVTLEESGNSTRRISANAGKKVAPKYRNPATGDTWTGRGLKPKWLTAALAAGRSLSDFAL